MTNKDLAAAAGVTTGALYHYVESKLDLYLEVHRDMQVQIYRRFQVAESSQDTFIGKLEAVLDAAHDLNREDPSLTKFVGAVRADTRRHPEIREALGDSITTRERFFTGIVEAGIDSGEVRRQDAELLQEFIRLILVGLTEGSSESLEQQRRAIDSIVAVVRGELVRRRSGDGRRRSSTRDSRRCGFRAWSRADRPLASIPGLFAGRVEPCRSISTSTQ